MRGIVILSIAATVLLRAQYPARTLSVLNYPNNARFVSMGGDGAGSLDGHSSMFGQYVIPEDFIFLNSISFRPPNWNDGENISFLQASVFRNLGQNSGMGMHLYGNMSARTTSYGEGSPVFLGNVQEYQVFLHGYYRRELLPNFSVGLGLKYYSASNNFITVFYGSPAQGRVDGSAFLLDVGTAWSRPVSDDPGSGTLHLLTSISNLGTPIVYANDLKFRLPRSFHAEAGYTQEFADAFISSVQGSFHYRNVLNSYNADNKIYWMMGAEAVIRKWVFLRSGWYITPYSTIFGERGKPVFTFGAGILLIGKNFRFEEADIQIDYAFVPIDDGMFPQLNLTGSKFNHVFTVTIINL